jgi:H+-transporting ATPase
MDEVFTFLKCSKEGLSSNEAQARAAMFGPNKLEERKVIIDPIYYFLMFYLLFFIVSQSKNQ